MLDRRTDLATLPERIQQIYNTCSRDEQVVLLQILRELSETGDSATYRNLWLADYKEIPVDKYTFLTSPEYLGNTNNNGKSIYPAWMDLMLELERAGNQFTEIILTGATRTGKTSTAVSDCAYNLYKLMCLRDPQQFFGLKSVTRISIFFFNLNETLAKGVAFKEFNSTLSMSPWFLSHGHMSNSESNPVYIPDGGLVEVAYGSSGVHALGKATFAVVMDEVNFGSASIKDINKAKERMKEKYDTLVARVTGTFVKGGECFGKIYVVSSKNSDSDFMEDYVKSQMAAGNKHMYVFDKPQWEVWPASKYSSNRTFPIAVGDRYKRSYVIPDSDNTPQKISELESQGYRIVQVPEDNKTRFLSDFDIALRDIAGISVVGSTGFIRQEVITPCVSTTRQNPFYTDTIQIGSKDNLTIESFFHIDEVPDKLKKSYISVHLDLAEVSDRQGIVASCIDGEKLVTDADGRKVPVPFIREIFAVGIEAPPGDRMSFQKVINFLMYLRRNHFNIQIITTDQYQSSYVRETLSQHNFNVDKISVDRTDDPYIGLKNCLYDQRIELVKHQLQEDEMINLTYQNGRLDHVANGSKDVSDALCGSVWNLIKNHIKATPPPQSLANILTSVNRPGGGRSISSSSTKRSTLYPGLYNTKK